MTEGPITKFSLPLSAVLAVFSAGSGLSILLSITYNVGYFTTLGIFTSELLSPGDIFSSAVTWLPLTFALLIVQVYSATVIAMEFKDFALGDSRSNWVHKKYRNGWRRLLFWGLAIGYILCNAAVFLFFEFPKWPFIFFLTVLMVGAPLSGFLLKRFGWFEKLDIHVIAVIINAPIVLSLLFAAGNSAALSDILNPSRHHALMAIHQNKEEPTQAYILRTLDKGMIVSLNPSKEIRLIAWDNVKEVGAPYSTYDMRPLICRVVAWRCPKGNK